jgi:tetratricopeptide (TPR) repeat protein
MKTIDFSTFIERHIAGEMSSSEKEWFLKELDGNEKLRKEVSLRKKVDEVLLEQSAETLRKKLVKIEGQRKMPINKKSRKRVAYIQYAAVITILILIGGMTLFSGRDMNSDEIINQYYYTYEPASSQRAGGSATNNDFTLALEFYNKQEYEKAAIMFNKVLESNPQDMQSVLLRGVSNFEEKKYPDAKQSFVTVINDNNNLFIENAKWYLALCYVKTEETDKAVNQLEMIRNEGGIYSKDAKKIIRKLK